MPKYGRPPQTVTYFPEESDFKNENFILHHIRKSRWLSIDVGNTKLLRMNWLVSLLASVVLWGFVLSCIVAPESTKSLYQEWQSWISQNLTWFYIATNDVWAVFLIWLCFSKYGKMKLGKDDSKPHYSDFTWFTMLFTCGVAVGVYTWGVSEPMNYYRSSSSNNLFRTPFGNDDERAQQAITVMLFHWGLHGYVVYSIVALLIGFVSYRWGLPMTIRSCFYPLLGDVVFGVLGDIIDALSIACTTFGVCTSLGFGASVMNAGLHRLNSDIAADSEGVQVVIILIVTAIATISVLSGLDRGIKHLSYFAFAVGVVFMLMVLFFDNTWYLLNAYVQSVGHYLQYIVQLGFFTDAYGQLAHEFESPDTNYLWGAGREVVFDKIEGIGGFNGTSAEFYQSNPKDWMDWWTIFYWGWWITWCPFVGMFIARISKGRSIRSVVFGTFFAPVIFLMLWLTIMGALGIKMERIVELATGVRPDVMNGSIDCSAMGYTDGVPTGDKAIELANLGFYAIACRPHSSRTYDVLESYGDAGMNTFLILLVLVGTFVYFITSSDSGSMVDDILASSGLLSPPPLQKIYWSFTEGATAIALLVSGGTDALSGLQAASICAGLPYTVAVCFMCVSLLRAVRIEYGDKETLSKSRFNTGILDVFEGFDPTHNEDTPLLPSPLRRGVLVLRSCVDFFTPTLKSSSVALSDRFGALSFAASSQCMMLSWILFLCLEPVAHGMAYLGWIMYIFLACHLGYLRMKVRERYNIIGSYIEDTLAFLFVYPLALAQLQMQVLAPLPAPVSLGDVELTGLSKSEKAEGSIQSLSVSRYCTHLSENDTARNIR